MVEEVDYDAWARSQKHHRKRRWSGWRAFVLAIVAPSGYPESVTSDYFSFQAWDTLQAVSSYMRGILCTTALLGALGVGDASATATSAAVMWIFRDAAGMMASVVFACIAAPHFTANLKQWRLFADYINDLGLTLELFAASMSLPTYIFVLLLCLSSVSKALCGVAAGSTRAAITHHFSQHGASIADVAAKEGVQETLVTLVGLMLGVIYANVVAPGSSTGLSVWIVFTVLTMFHVYANYKAVTSLALNTISWQRCCILMKKSWTGGGILSPEEVAFEETVFSKPWDMDHGVRFGTLLSDVVHSRTEFLRLYTTFIGQRYMISHHKRHCVVFHADATPEDKLQSLVQLYLMLYQKQSLASSLQTAVEFTPKFSAKLRECGWNVSEVYLSLKSPTYDYWEHGSPETPDASVRKRNSVKQ